LAAIAIEDGVVGRAAGAQDVGVAVNAGSYDALGHYAEGAAVSARHSDLGNRQIEQDQDIRTEDSHKDQGQTEVGATSAPHKAAYLNPFP